jgi:hypothetical protein
MRVGEDGEVRDIEGTVRADSCTYFTARKGGFQDYMCSGCSGLPSSRTFMTALKSALGEQPAVLCVDDYDPNVNNSLLTRVHLEHKAGCLARSLHLSEKSLWNAKVHFVKGKSCHYKLRASPAKATMELPFARNYPAATS